MRETIFTLQKWLDAQVPVQDSLGAISDCWRVARTLGGQADGQHGPYQCCTCVNGLIESPSFPSCIIYCVPYTHTNVEGTLVRSFSTIFLCLVHVMHGIYYNVLEDLCFWCAWAPPPSLDTVLIQRECSIMDVVMFSCGLLVKSADRSSKEIHLHYFSASRLTSMSVNPRQTALFPYKPSRSYRVEKWQAVVSSMRSLPSHVPSPISLPPSIQLPPLPLPLLLSYPSSSPSSYPSSCPSSPFPHPPLPTPPLPLPSSFYPLSLPLAPLPSLLILLFFYFCYLCIKSCRWISCWCLDVPSPPVSNAAFTQRQVLGDFSSEIAVDNCLVWSVTASAILSES